MNILNFLPDEQLSGIVGGKSTKKRRSTKKHTTRKHAKHTTRKIVKSIKRTTRRSGRRSH